MSIDENQLGGLRAQQAANYGLARPRIETTDEAIAVLRTKAEHLRRQIASVPEWERELLRIEATLKAWGDK